jgi:hypothetical protein
MYCQNGVLQTQLLQVKQFLMVQLLQTPSNLITNQRYSQMTYDGYHFQLGTMFNLSLNYKF